jgi:hypothetical protein
LGHGWSDRHFFKNWRHPKQTLGQRRGKTIINLVSERRILLYVMAMAGGVILAAAWSDAGVLTMLAAASAGMLSGAI